MDDLIRREELLTSQFVHTECYLQENKDRHLDVYKKGWNDALQAAHDNAPAVDAVEVVRCKDCKWCSEDYDTDGNVPYWTCKNWDCGTDADGFCHEAERKTDG